MPLHQATAFRLPFKDKSIQVIFTSPPYYGLRVYDGLSPQVFGGDSACDHVWGPWQETHDVREETAHAKSRTTERFYGDESRRFDGNHQKHISGAFCQRCGAWLGHLGNEPTPQMYIEHLVTIGREFWRVLRDDGVLLLNLGDSFANVGKWGGCTGGKHVDELHGNTGVGRQKRDYDGFKPKDKLGIPHWAVRELQAAGWYHRVDIPWIKRNGMPDSTMDRPGVSHEYFFMLTKSKRYFWDAEAVKQPVAQATIEREKHGYEHAFANQFKGSPVDGRHQDGKQVDRISDPAGRQFRTLDTWQDSLDHLIEETLAHLAALEATRETGGLLLDDAGLPLALYGATQPYPGSHYAVFPPNVVTDLLKDATSERGCCRACGKPWERVVEKELKNSYQDRPSRCIPGRTGNGHNKIRAGDSSSSTQGWQPACTCDAGEPVPSFVCDPFCGSGTVGQVCRELAAEGRPVTFLGTDLSGEYLTTHAAVRAEGRSPEAALASARERIEKRYRKAKDSLKVIKEEARGQPSFLNGR